MYTNILECLWQGKNVLSSSGAMTVEEMEQGLVLTSNQERKYSENI